MMKWINKQTPTTSFLQCLDIILIDEVGRVFFSFFEYKGFILSIYERGSGYHKLDELTTNWNLRVDGKIILKIDRKLDKDNCN